MISSNRIFILIVCLFSSGSAMSQLLSFSCSINNSPYKEYQGFYKQVVSDDDVISIKGIYPGLHAKYRIDTVIIALNLVGSDVPVTRGMKTTYATKLLILPKPTPTSAEVVIPVSKYLKPLYLSFSDEELGLMNEGERKAFLKACKNSDHSSRMKILTRGVIILDNNNQAKAYEKKRQEFLFICSE